MKKKVEFTFRTEDDRWGEEKNEFYLHLNKVEPEIIDYIYEVFGDIKHGDNFEETHRQVKEKFDLTNEDFELGYLPDLWGFNVSEIKMTYIETSDETHQEWDLSYQPKEKGWVEMGGEKYYVPLSYHLCKVIKTYEPL